MVLVYFFFAYHKDNMWMCLQFTFVSLLGMVIITPSPDRHDSRVTVLHINAVTSAFLYTAFKKMTNHEHFLCAIKYLVGRPTTGSMCMCRWSSVIPHLGLAVRLAMSSTGSARSIACSSRGHVPVEEAARRSWRRQVRLVRPASLCRWELFDPCPCTRSVVRISRRAMKVSPS